MNDNQIAVAQELNKQLGSIYHHAAAGQLVWKQERAFFEAQWRRNDKIRAAVYNGVEATIESLKLAVRECAGMGLSMSPNAQLIYFIPRRARKRKDNESKSEYEAHVPWIVTATPSYRGLAYIATHYAGAEVVAAEVVYGADEFNYLGPITAPYHRQTTDNSQRTERDAIGVYAIVQMQSGGVRCEYVDAPTVQKIRQRSDFPNSLMWTTLWTEGWKKAAIRRICKTVMITDRRMEIAVGALNRNEGITFDENPAIEHHSRSDKATGTAGLRQALARPPRDDSEFAAVPSDHPEGSIEWWMDQVNGADTLEQLDAVKAQALLSMLDEGDDWPIFEKGMEDRKGAIREAA